MATSLPEQIDIVLADDQALFRAGLEMLIESQPDLRLVGSAANGREAVDVVRATHPAVVLMDIRMPVLDGIAATEIILASASASASAGADADLGAQEPAPRILVLTTMRHDEAVVRAIRAGASGFVLKDAEPEFLLAAIRTVHQGQAVIAPAQTFDLIREFGGKGVRRANEAAIEPLTPRERDIFALVAKGLSNAEVASSSFVSETTVKTHLSAVMTKLGLRSRVQLVSFAWENGLVG
ncbi:MAG: DNA-binding response regulator [Microbacteriaceae bacterium]|nr:DNA-binding response regulator [Microbacteriaceae bacterium]